MGASGAADRRRDAAAGEALGQPGGSGLQAPRELGRICSPSWGCGPVGVLKRCPSTSWRQGRSTKTYSRTCTITPQEEPGSFVIPETKRAKAYLVEHGVRSG